MTSRPRTTEDWICQIDEGLEYRRRFGLEDMWGTLEAIYYNVHESMMNDGPNILLSQGDALMSTLTVPSAAVRVKPIKPEEVQTAPIVETIDNTLIRELALPEEVETATLHAYLFGVGIIKSGYDSEWGYSPEHDMGGKLQLGLTLTQLNRAGSRRIEYDSAISPGSPWCKAVDSRDIVVPWGTKELDRAPWIAHRVCRNIDDLRADRKYENTRDLPPQISFQDFMDSYRTTQRMRVGKLNTKEPNHVEMWEIHDRATGRILVVTRDWPKYLRNDTNALQIENKLPFDSVSFTPRTRSFWTTPDAYYLYYIQSELSDTALQRTKQRRISTLKFLYDENVIEEEEFQKILSPDVGVAAKINSAADINKAILKIDNQPSQQLAIEEDLLRANAREQIGFSRNQLGEFTGGRKTAREVDAVDNSSKLRMSRRGIRIKRLYENVIRTVNNIIFTYWTMPKYVSILGQDQTQQWLSVNGPALRGRYDYAIEFTDEAELERRKVEALQLYSTLSQDPSLDPGELRMFLINRVNDPTFTRLFSATPRLPVQQQGVSTPGGSVSPGNDGSGSAAANLSQVQRSNGQARQSNPTRLLAGRGINA